MKCSPLLVSALLAALPAFGAAKVLDPGTTSGDRKSYKITDQLSVQSTGRALLDECPGEYGLGANCVTMELNSTGQLDDMKSHPGAEPRQRIEFIGPTAASGEHWTYSWNYRLDPEVTSPGGFFHIGQIITRTTPGGPKYTMDIVQDKVMIQPIGKSNAECASMALSAFKADTMRINVDLLYPAGPLTWSVTNAGTGKVAMSCHLDKVNVPGNTNVKTGLYRAVTAGDKIKPAQAWVGGYTAKKL